MNETPQEEASAVVHLKTNPLDKDKAKRVHTYIGTRLKHRLGQTTALFWKVGAIKDKLESNKNHFLVVPCAYIGTVSFYLGLLFWLPYSFFFNFFYQHYLNCNSYFINSTDNKNHPKSLFFSSSNSIYNILSTGKQPATATSCPLSPSSLKQ